MSSDQQQPTKFGTFTGVFTPTLLTILGVIMYVRLGWVVGNGGLLGAFLIMGLATVITVATGLSLSSIATNTRLGAGGPYAIISKSLGLEVGGSIGVPLYLSRPIGVAMYVFGFREGWQWVFPDHSALLIDLVVFAALFAISYISANLAFRVQFLIMAIIGLSLVSIWAGTPTYKPAVEEITWVGHYPGFPERGFGGVSFWEVFAVFFPATTGILAGANMSGDLKDPRRAIPHGALGAIALSTVVYFSLAWWAARAGTMEELATNYTLVIDRAFFPPVVLAGLLGATFSSALASMVGGPRILMAMGQDDIVPASSWLARTAKGEPRNAIVLTAVLTFAALMVRDLNVIAPLVTMFFLITYCVLNVVVLLEGALGLVSFRPTLRIPWFIPLVGAVGSVFAMFIVSPTFGVISVSMVVGIYVFVQRRVASRASRGLALQREDVRSSIFVAMAEWAAKRSTDLESSNPRAWKPKLLIPVEDPATIRGEFHFLLDTCLPEGSVKLLGIAHIGADGLTTAEIVHDLQPRMVAVTKAFQRQGVFATWSVVDAAGFTTGTAAGLQALQGAFFRPNILFLTMPEMEHRHDEFQEVIAQARRTRVGVMLLGLHPKAGLGQRAAVNLWVRPQPPEWDARDAFNRNNLNLILLMGYRLLRRWRATLSVLTVVGHQDDVSAAEAFLREICELARLPAVAKVKVLVGEYEECVAKEPPVDLNVLGLQPNPDFPFCTRMVRISHTSCLFVADSGRESALA